MRFLRSVRAVLSGHFRKIQRKRVPEQPSEATPLPPERGPDAQPEEFPDDPDEADLPEVIPEPDPSAEVH